MKRILLFILLGFLFLSVSGQIGRYPLSYISDTLNANYRIVYNAMTEKPTGDTISWQNKLVDSLDVLNYWDRIKLLYIGAVGDSSDAKINWPQPGTYNLSNISSDPVTHVKYEGWDANGTNDYLSTTWCPSTDTLKIAHTGLNDITIAVWSLSEVNGNYNPIGVYDLSGLGISLTPSTSSALRARITSKTLSNFGDPTTTIGLLMVTRRANNDLEAYVNGTPLVTTDNDASYTSMPNMDLYTLAINWQGSPANYFPGKICIILVMNAVTDTEAENIYDIFNRYLNRIGAI